MLGKEKKEIQIPPSVNITAFPRALNDEKNLKIRHTIYGIRYTNFVFFGTDDFSVIVLDELKKAGFMPALIVTATDKKMGRGMRLTPPPVKLWAEQNHVPFLQPQKLDEEFSYKLKTNNYQLFVVASYGKIIPKRVLDIPAHGALNVHPSLLPLYRGSSPIEQQILDDTEKVGVTIMKMDEQMDHGPIVAQQQWEFSIFNFQFSNNFQIPNYSELHDALAHLGGQLLAETIPKWLAREIKPREQNHAKATYTKKITKEDGLIDLNGDAEKNYRKFLAYTPWPGIYFFETLNNKKFRIKITDAEFADGTFVIKKVIPEGKKETSYKLFRSSAR